MSFLARIFPFLFDEVKKTTSSEYASSDRHQNTPDTDDLIDKPATANLSNRDKARLIQHPQTPLSVLSRFSRDKDDNIQLLLAKRIAALIKKTKADDRETTALLLQTIRQLTEESITPVRIALVSALKDVAHCPPDLARKLADDMERDVAEPIIRYSLSLSDQDLLHLIARHPQDWHTATIAQRKFVSPPVSKAVIETGNKKAGIALLDNDGAIIDANTLHHLPQTLAQDQDMQNALQRRNSLSRKIKRDVFILAQRRVQELLHHHARLDRHTTEHLIDTVQRRIAIQDNDANLNPATLSETDIKDALAVGNDALAIKAIAIKAGTTEDIARRMLVDSSAAKPVIALCSKAGLSMGLAVFLQQRLTHLPPTKIIYAKNGTENPLSLDDIRWQLEFFGVI